MSEDYELPDSCYCNATSNPPCGFCESCFVCEECGSTYREDQMNEDNGKFLCSDCFEKLEEPKDKITVTVINLDNRQNSV